MENGKKLSEQKLQVALGETEMMVASGIRSNVFKLIIHENYDQYVRENDIALLLLESQVTYNAAILPICLPTQGVLSDSKFGKGFVIGFGSTEVELHGSLFLVEAEIPIVSNEECFENDLDFFEKYLDKDKFCAGQKNELKNICEGADSFNSYWL